MRQGHSENLRFRNARDCVALPVPPRKPLHVERDVRRTGYRGGETPGQSQSPASRGSVSPTLMKSTPRVLSSSTVSVASRAVTILTRGGMRNGNGPWRIGPAATIRGLVMVPAWASCLSRRMSSSGDVARRSSSAQPEVSESEPSRRRSSQTTTLHPGHFPRITGDEGGLHAEERGKGGFVDSPDEFRADAGEERQQALLTRYERRATGSGRARLEPRTCRRPRSGQSGPSIDRAQ